MTLCVGFTRIELGIDMIMAWIIALAKVQAKLLVNLICPFQRRLRCKEHHQSKGKDTSECNSHLHVVNNLS